MIHIAKYLNHSEHFKNSLSEELFVFSPLIEGQN